MFHPESLKHPRKINLLCALVGGDHGGPGWETWGWLSVLSNQVPAARDATKELSFWSKSLTWLLNNDFSGTCLHFWFHFFGLKVAWLRNVSKKFPHSYDSCLPCAGMTDPRCLPSVSNGQKSPFWDRFATVSHLLSTVFFASTAWSANCNDDATNMQFCLSCIEYVSPVKFKQWSSNGKIHGLTLDPISNPLNSALAKSGCWGASAPPFHLEPSQSLPSPTAPLLLCCNLGCWRTQPTMRGPWFCCFLLACARTLKTLIRWRSE